MDIQILPLGLTHFESLRIALDTVAKEKRYLAFTEAPPPEEAYKFYQNILAKDHSHFVAVLDGKVVGWCDVLPVHGQARRHVGTLGMGLVPSVRNNGIGYRLIQDAISKAHSKGLTRIELTVRADNANAKALYERVGFANEGLQIQSIGIDGIFYDSYLMALLV
jgi:RimJ/RimL family protein N-acetyltransferase